eukprot:3670127-Alexandrium_andersonii.AAC.1
MSARRKGPGASAGSVPDVRLEPPRLPYGPVPPVAPRAQHGMTPGTKVRLACAAIGRARPRVRTQARARDRVPAWALARACACVGHARFLR